MWIPKPWGIEDKDRPNIARRLYEDEVMLRGVKGRGTRHGSGKRNIEGDMDTKEDKRAARERDQCVHIGL